MYCIRAHILPYLFYDEAAAFMPGVPQQKLLEAMSRIKRNLREDLLSTFKARWFYEIKGVLPTTTACSSSTSYATITTNPHLALKEFINFSAEGKKVSCDTEFDTIRTISGQKFTGHFLSSLQLHSSDGHALLLHGNMVEWALTQMVQIMQKRNKYEPWLVWAKQAERFFTYGKIEMQDMQKHEFKKDGAGTMIRLAIGLKTTLNAAGLTCCENSKEDYTRYKSMSLLPFKLYQYGFNDVLGLTLLRDAYEQTNAIEK